MENPQNDRAGKAYWDDIWKDPGNVELINPHAPGLNNYVNRELHKVIVDVLSSHKTRGQRLLELGCGTSAWLPYFAREFGFHVYGIDYSETGCRNAERLLCDAGVTGEIICADFFAPPRELLNNFDVVVSFGVAEHFSDTAECISAFSRFLRPGGVMLTLIPNMKGLPGFLQKVMQREVYDIHVPIDTQSLSKAHERAGLRVSRSQYSLPINLNVVNIEPSRGSIRYTLFVRLRSWTSKIIWSIQSRVPFLPPNFVTSPYLICVAEKTS